MGSFGFSFISSALFCKGGGAPKQAFDLYEEPGSRYHDAEVATSSHRRPGAHFMKGHFGQIYKFTDKF
jgi:hypothetical protein